MRIREPNRVVTAKASSPAEQVRDNEAASRFELAVAGKVAVAVYEKSGKILTFTHTVVPPEARGNGIGEKLIKGALDLVRQRGQKFVPVCSFVVAYVQRHPEVRDLLASNAKA